MDEDDDFYDTASVNSHSLTSKRSNNKDYVSLSTNTLYHSAIDVGMELDNLDSASTNVNHVNKVATNPKTVTYTQWRDRVYF